MFLQSLFPTVINFPSAGKQSEMSKRSQESSSPGSPTAKARACCPVSRESVSVGQNHSSNTQKSQGVQETLKRGTEKKEIQNPDGILFSMPRETESMVMFQKILEVSQKRMPRETESVVMVQKILEVSQKRMPWETESVVMVQKILEVSQKRMVLSIEIDTIIYVPCIEVQVPSLSSPVVTKDL